MCCYSLCDYCMWWVRVEVEWAGARSAAGRETAQDEQRLEAKTAGRAGQRRTSEIE